MRSRTERRQGPRPEGRSPQKEGGGEVGQKSEENRRAHLSREESLECRLEFEETEARAL